MKTAFSQERFEFTKRAHLAAQQQFYAHMFPAGVEFEDTTQTAHDLDYAIDCQLAVTLPGPNWKAPIRFGVQERFREPKEMHWGDITVTEWNLATNQPSELHKLGAQMFVYGFYDERADRIIYAAAVDVAFMQYALSHGDIEPTRRSRGDQSFIGLPIGSLRAIGAVMYEYDSRAQERVA